MSAGNMLSRITDFIRYLASPDEFVAEPAEPRAPGSFLRDIAASEVLPQEPPADDPLPETRFLAWLLCFDDLAEEPAVRRTPGPGFVRWLLGSELLEQDTDGGAK